jgi:hypothetical protein
MGTSLVFLTPTAALIALGAVSDPLAALFIRAAAGEAGASRPSRIARAVGTASRRGVSSLVLAGGRLFPLALRRRRPVVERKR